MEKFHVDQNWISGTIPEDITERWPHLRSLDLHQNLMHGKLPASLLQLENLTQLQISDNDFVCGESSVEKSIVYELFTKPLMRTFNAVHNPKLCGCTPARTSLEAQLGHTAITIGNCRDNEDDHHNRVDDMSTSSKHKISQEL